VNTRNKKLLIIGSLATIIIMLILVLPQLFIIYQSKDLILDSNDISHHQYGVIFGAGVNDKKRPNDILEDRLNTGAQLYLDEKVDFIISSGNNEDKNNNETDSMANYLLEDMKLPEENVYQDPKGYRTYDTCARVGLFIEPNEKVILVTQQYHLYRALFTCKKLGVDVVGVSATDGNYDNQTFYSIREFFAHYKAIIDIYIFEPDWEKE
jgi:vancomycin permeability regulator SanA